MSSEISVKCTYVTKIFDLMTKAITCISDLFSLNLLFKFKLTIKIYKAQSYILTFKGITIDLKSSHDFVPFSVRKVLVGPFLRLFFKASKKFKSMIFYKYNTRGKHYMNVKKHLFWVLYRV